MKVKTSITLSDTLLQEIDQIAGYKNRSDAIEQALRLFILLKAKKLRDEADLKILNKKASRLNEEAEDVLSYQADI